jgi:predicted GH43/DUF377 family glycosyl hydrolase
MEIVGSYNAGAAKLGDDIFMLVRITEMPAEQPNNHVLLPYAACGDRPDAPYVINFDRPSKSELRRITPKEVEFKDNRSNRLRHISHFRLARMSGRNEIDWIDPDPTFYPQFGYEQFGVEDPRITPMTDEPGFYISYVTPHRDRRISTSLAWTEDFKTFKRYPFGFPGNILTGKKNSPMFPRKLAFPDRLGDESPKYCIKLRPQSFTGLNKPSIWITWSADMVYWDGQGELVIGIENEVCGASAPPVETPYGWLELDHHFPELPDGQDDDGNKKTRRPYSNFLCLTGIDRPWKVKAISPDLWGPGEFDVDSFVKDATYCCGWAFDVDDDFHGQAHVISGEFDRHLAIRSYDADELMNFVRNGEQRPKSIVAADVFKNVPDKEPVTAD